MVLQRTCSEIHNANLDPFLDSSLPVPNYRDYGSILQKSDLEEC